MNVKKLTGSAAACAAAFLIFSSGAVAAWDFSFLQTKTPSLKTDINNGGNSGAASASVITAQSGPASGTSCADFEGFNSLYDPLYREGSKALLQKALDADKLKPEPCAPVRPSSMRDAPADIPAKTGRPVPALNNGVNNSPVLPVKKNRLIKMIPVDPVKAKSTL
jgi:hypothetical protein